MTHHTRIGIILSITILATVGVFFLPPLAQDPAYHDFADKRTFLGIPNCLDVLSNLIFLFVGVAGLISLKTVWNNGTLLADTSGKRLWLTLFCAIALTSLGSAYYHWSPDNDRLVWDRLFIALTLMILLSIILVERMRIPWIISPGLALVAMGSVFYWDYTEHRGVGDLRPYLLAQFFPLLMIPCICILFPAPYKQTRNLMFAFGWYALAKLFEYFDKGIYNLAGLSGHTLKHIVAGVGSFYLLRYLRSWQKSEIL